MLKTSKTKRRFSRSQKKKKDTLPAKDKCKLRAGFSAEKVK